MAGSGAFRLPPDECGALRPMVTVRSPSLELYQSFGGQQPTGSHALSQMCLWRYLVLCASGNDSVTGAIHSSDLPVTVAIRPAIKPAAGPVLAFPKAWAGDAKWLFSRVFRHFGRHGPAALSTPAGGLARYVHAVM